MQRGLLWGLIGSLVVNAILVVAVVRLGADLDEERAQRIDLEIQLDELLTEQFDALEPPAAPTPPTAPAAASEPATP